jgi:hypothetical protein
LKKNGKLKKSSLKKPAKTYIKNAEVTAKKFAAQHKIKLKYADFN